MRTPAIWITAYNNVPAAANADEDEAEGLHPLVLLAKKARVMLTTNVAIISVPQPPSPTSDGSV
jgi:hypothetical protein